jgi:DNA-binding transcriptional ArsR family regulator
LKIDYMSPLPSIPSRPASDPLDGVFQALSDPTRRAMLRSLAGGERNIGELAAPFAMSFAAASKHVRVLETAGLLRRRVEGRVHLCRIEAGPLAAVEQWLAFYQGYWSSSLDALEAALKADDALGAHSGQSAPAATDAPTSRTARSRVKVPARKSTKGKQQ